MSTLSFREPTAEPVRTNMWRADVERVPQYQTDIKRQIMALEREKVEQGLAKLKQKRFSKPSSLMSSSSLHSVSSNNGTRSSPRKLSTFRRPDMLSSTTMASVQEVSTPDMEVSVFDMPAADGNNADFELTVPAQSASNSLPESPSKSGSNNIRQSPRKALSSRNAYDVLKSAASGQTTSEQKKPLTKVKKLTKKLPKRQELDQTSFLEDSVAAKINSGGLTRKKVNSS